MKVPWTRPNFNEKDAYNLNDVMESGWITQGDEVEKFEQELADYIGCKYVVCASSGTAALMLCYILLSERKKNVITTDSTFLATTSVAELLGYTTTYIDIDSKTLLINLNLLEESLKYITDGVVVPVHLLGNVVDMEEMKEKIKYTPASILEDGCQAFGTEVRNKKVGSESDLCVFSFHIGKLITTGEGGCIAINDLGHYNMLRALRTHGIMTEPYISFFRGINARMTDLQAAIGRSQLERVESFISHREKLSMIYIDELMQIEQISVPYTPNYITRFVNLFFPIIIPDALTLGGHLKYMGIETRRFFPSMKRQKYYINNQVDMDTNVLLARETCLLLPMGNGITKEEVKEVCRLIKKFYKKN